MGGRTYCQGRYLLSSRWALCLLCHCAKLYLTAQCLGYLSIQGQKTDWGIIMYIYESPASLLGNHHKSTRLGSSESFKNTCV